MAFSFVEDDACLYAFFLKYRHLQYFLYVFRDSNRDAWPGLADYLAQTVRHPSAPHATPIRIRLTRHGVIIPTPKNDVLIPLDSSLDYKLTYEFYIKEYRS